MVVSAAILAARTTDASGRSASVAIWASDNDWVPIRDGRVLRSLEHLVAD